MSNPSGRIKPIVFADIIDVGRNKCGICGRTGETSEIFADPSIYEEFIGNTYFCKDCSIELGMFFGAIPSEWHQAVVDDNEYLMKQNIELRSSVAKLEAVVDSLTIERLVSRGVLADGNYPAAGVASIEAVNEPIQSTETDNTRPAQFEPKFVEPSTISRPDDINESPSDNSVDGLLASLGVPADGN